MNDQKYARKLEDPREIEWLPFPYTAKSGRRVCVLRTQFPELESDIHTLEFGRCYPNPDCESSQEAYLGIARLLQKKAE